MKCKDCEYEQYCFWLLRKTNTIFPDSCQQGRRKREYRAKPVTLDKILYKAGDKTTVAYDAGEQKVPTREKDAQPGTDTTVEKVLPV